MDPAPDSVTDSGCDLGQILVGNDPSGCYNLSENSAFFRTCTVSGTIGRSVNGGLGDAAS